MPTGTCNNIAPDGTVLAGSRRESGIRARSGSVRSLSIASYVALGRGHTSLRMVNRVRLVASRWLYRWLSMNGIARVFVGHLVLLRAVCSD